MIRYDKFWNFVSIRYSMGLNLKIIGKHGEFPGWSSVVLVYRWQFWGHPQSLGPEVTWWTSRNPSCEMSGSPAFLGTKWQLFSNHSVSIPSIAASFSGQIFNGHMRCLRCLAGPKGTIWWLVYPCSCRKLNCTSTRMTGEMNRNDW